VYRWAVFAATYQTFVYKWAVYTTTLQTVVCYL
jgi:hypothetical protein